MAFIEVMVDSVRFHKEVGQHVVILKETGSDRYLPLWTTDTQAYAIGRKMFNMNIPQPMVHDLICNLIDVTGLKLLYALISRIENNNFYSCLVIQLKKSKIEVACMPTDAIAVALRAVAPIYVEESVLDEAGLIIDKETGKPISPPKEGL